MYGQAAAYSAAGIGVSLVCVLALSWFGPAGALLNLLTPVPAAYVALRFGMRWGLMVVIGITLALLLLTTYTALTYLALFGVGSLLLAFCLLMRISWDHSAIIAAFGATVFALLVMAVVVMSGPHSVTGLISQMVQAEVDQAMAMYRSAGFSDTQLLEMERGLQSIAGFVQRCFIGLYLAITLALQGLTLILLRRLVPAHVKFAGTDFAGWRLPTKLIWALIGAGFASFLPLPLVAAIGWNLLLVVLPLYFVQGLAVISSFMRSKPWPGPIKGLIYLLLVVLNPLPLFVIAIGVFDLWIDFRKLKTEQVS